jgi:uncharacterized protein YneF (UPF0154 family)
MNIPKVMGIIIVIILGILIGFILGILCIKRKKNDNFTVVEENVDKIITIQENSLLSKIDKKEEVVQNIWGCSELGKEMKLC